MDFKYGVYNKDIKASMMKDMQWDSQHPQLFFWWVFFGGGRSRGVVLIFLRRGVIKWTILFHSQGNTLRTFSNSFNKAESGSHCGFSNMSSSHITRVLDQWLMEITHWSGTLAKNIWVNDAYLSNIWIFLLLHFYYFIFLRTKSFGKMWFRLIWESVNK